MTSHCSHHPEEEQWQCWWQWPCLWSSDNCQAPVLNAWHVFSHLIITRTQHSGNRHLFFKGGSGDKRGYFPQDHTASKEVSWNLSPVLLDPRAHALHWSIKLNVTKKGKMVLPASLWCCVGRVLGKKVEPESSHEKLFSLWDILPGS